MEGDAVEVASFRFLHQAELAASALRAAGIRCRVPDRYGHSRPFDQGAFTGGGYSVLVAMSDAQRAKEILNADVK